jgi:hypothetical protein
MSVQLNAAGGFTPVVIEEESRWETCSIKG